MVIITKSVLVHFGLKHAKSVSALNDWYKITKASNWNNLSDVKRTYNSVDYIGNDRYVFNIKGNNYIRFIGTHSEYDKIDCLTI